MPSPYTVSGMLPAELMYTRKIKSILNNLQPDRKARISRNNKNISKHFKPGDKVFLKCTKAEKNARKMVS